ncbi:MAG: DUF4386 domain-containing protein [Candidatus Electryonea clarkiae]|nr:DUF4386 domain-containing protein [Candidatus Electryonea clarkiae]MDP8287925.1 DUF4386 domain-containing protein [Candidatus Electryonea clarkiae]
MNLERKAAIIVGVLFIISTVAGILTVVLLEHLLKDPDYLTKVAANETQVIIGAIFDLICAGAFVGIAIIIFPVLKKHNENIAIGYVVGRSFEAVPFVIGVTSLLSLLILSQEYVQAEVPDVSSFLPLGSLLLTVRDWSNMLGARLFCGIAALPFYYLLYQTKLVPRFISIWGLIGTILYLSAAMLIMFGLSPVAMISVLLTLPFALNEMALAVWLIVKGFNSDVIVSRSA